MPKPLEMLETGLTMGWLPILVGTLVAYLSGVFAIRAMVNLVSRGRLHYFAFYCFAIGTLGLIFI